MSAAPKPHSHFPRPSGPSVFATFVVIVGCMLALGLVVWLTYMPNRGESVTVDLKQVPEDQHWKYSPEGRKARLEMIRANEVEMLNNYSWVDQSTGIVRVPVDRAIELVVAEQGKTKP